MWHIKTMSKTHLPPYRVAIIGAGDIGAGFDSPRSRAILTYAHAFSNNSRTRLVAMVDIDEARGRRAARRWRAEFFTDVVKMFASSHPDIIVIATPDNTHAALLEKVAAYAPKLVVCEKPVACTEREIEHLEVVFHKNRIPVVVNFRRRFDLAVKIIREAIVSGQYGKIISASGVYTRGILHNGPHLFDLARYLFGEVRQTSTHFLVDDCAKGDPTIGGVATFERCPQFYLIPGDGRHFSVFELDILAEKGRVRFIDEGLFIETQNVIPDPNFRGYFTLGKVVRKQTGLLRSMPTMARHTVAILDGKEKSLATLDDALQTQRACLKFLKISKKYE